VQVFFDLTVYHRRSRVLSEAFLALLLYYSPIVKGSEGSQGGSSLISRCIEGSLDGHILLQPGVKFESGVACRGVDGTSRIGES